MELTVSAAMTKQSASANAPYATPSAPTAAPIRSASTAFASSPVATGTPAASWRFRCSSSSSSTSRRSPVGSASRSTAPYMAGGLKWPELGLQRSPRARETADRQQIGAAAALGGVGGAGDAGDGAQSSPRAIVSPNDVEGALGVLGDDSAVQTVQAVHDVETGWLEFQRCPAHVAIFSLAPEWIARTQATGCHS